VNPEGPVAIGWPQLAGAAALLSINGLLSVWLGLGMEGRLAVAAVRTVVQLTLLGAILVPVMQARSPWLVGLVCTGMVALGARESVRRVSRRYGGMYPAALVSLGIAAGTTSVLATAALLQVEPWWEPRYLIPLLGMILGNGLTGIGLGLDRCIDRLDRGRQEVEVWLARGASRWEAARPVAADAVRTGMIPILNTMSVVGVVSIPGMMTGQILGGSDPALAARYQILIIFLIAAATALGTASAVLLSIRALFDDGHRLRVDRLTSR
jgi:putative ABC transport system permease protein